MLDVFEGMRGKTSIASMIIKITSTINKLLLWEGNVLSFSKNVPVGLHRSNSGEGPAWSAWSLVLDRCDNFVVIPFIALGNCFEFDFLLHSKSICGWAFLRFHESLLWEFLKGHIREIIDPLLPSVVSNIVVSDFNESYEEGLEAIIRFGCVGWVKLIVDLFCYNLVKDTLAIEEISVLYVEMDVAEGQSQQCC